MVVVGGQASFAEQLLDVTIGQRKSQVPPHRTGSSPQVRSVATWTKVAVILAFLQVIRTAPQSTLPAFCDTTGEIIETLHVTRDQVQTVLDCTARRAAPYLSLDTNNWTLIQSQKAAAAKIDHPTGVTILHQITHYSSGHCEL